MKIPVIRIETENNPVVHIRTDKDGWQQVLAKYCQKKKVISKKNIQMEESKYLKKDLT